MKHVFGKRNKVAIWLRRQEARLFAKLTRLAKKNIPGNKEGKTKEIYCYPPFKNDTEKKDMLNRFAWAFPEESGIVIKYSQRKSVREEKNHTTSGFPEDQCRYLNSNSNIIEVPAEDTKTAMKEASVIAIHKKKSRYSYKLWPYFGKCKIVDPEYYSLEEGNFWKFGYYNRLEAEEKEQFRQLSLENFLKFKEIHRQKNEAHIFVTGPSFGSYKQFDFESDTLKIVCNTIVKDTEFMEYIGGPDIITFADPVFHFSSNSYACEFRRLVLKAVEKYGAFVAVPQATVPMLVGNHPELKEKIIGLRKSEAPVFPSEENLAVKPSGSIITFIMIPLAASLAKKTYILGADGRGKNENYFWKHNDKVQLTELMDSVFRSHPSFFRDRDYADHYDEHCEYIEALFTKGEKELNRDFYSLTESFIPALKKRELPANQPEH